MTLGLRPTSHASKHRDVRSGDSWRPIAIFCPLVHQSPPLLEQIATAIGGLHLIADRMRERHLDHVVWERRRLGGPVSKRAAETVHRNITATHLPQSVQHRVLR